MIRRINFVAGPGVGKSTVAARVYANLKAEGRSVELATEYVKGWAYLDRQIKQFDQLYLVNKQLQKEYVPLEAGVDLIVSDCPLFLPLCYSTLAGWESISEILALTVDAFDAEYEPLYIYIERTTQYKTEGRYQTEECARVVDDTILRLLAEHNKSFITVKIDDDIESIIKYYLM